MYSDDHDSRFFGEGDETRTLTLMHVLNETASDAQILAFGLQVLQTGKAELPSEIEVEFLRGLASKISSRVQPYVSALSNEYLMIRQQHQAHFH